MTSRIPVVAGLLILLAWGTVFAAEPAAPADKPQPVFLWPGGACGSNRGDDRSQYAFSVDAPAASVYSLSEGFLHRRGAAGHGRGRSPAREIAEGALSNNGKAISAIGSQHVPFAVPLSLQFSACSASLR